MFKKTVVLSVAVALILLGLYVDPSAAQSNVTSVSKRGALLVWPKIEVSDTTDTIIMIGNDGASNVTLKCYWMDKTQAAWDFEIELTAFQPVWFSARDGYGTYDVSQFGLNPTATDPEYPLRKASSSAGRLPFQSPLRAPWSGCGNTTTCMGMPSSSKAYLTLGLSSIMHGHFSSIPTPVTPEAGIWISMVMNMTIALPISFITSSLTTPPSLTASQPSAILL